VAVDRVESWEALARAFSSMADTVGEFGDRFRAFRSPLATGKNNAMSSVWSALVIDDDPGIRQSLGLCLETDGARVLGVGTASGALEALDRGCFHIVFLLSPTSGPVFRLFQSVSRRPGRLARWLPDDSGITSPPRRRGWLTSRETAVQTNDRYKRLMTPARIS
jgi:hypothetical protein